MLVELVVLAFPEPVPSGLRSGFCWRCWENGSSWPFGIGGISSEELGRAKRGESRGSMYRPHQFNTVVLAGR